MKVFATGHAPIDPAACAPARTDWPRPPAAVADRDWRRVRAQADLALSQVLTAAIDCPEIRRLEPRARALAEHIHRAEPIDREHLTPWLDELTGIARESMRHPSELGALMQLRDEAHAYVGASAFPSSSAARAGANTPTPDARAEPECDGSESPLSWGTDWSRSSSTSLSEAANEVDESNEAAMRRPVMRRVADAAPGGYVNLKPLPPPKPAGLRARSVDTARACARTDAAAPLDHQAVAGLHRLHLAMLDDLGRLAPLTAGPARDAYRARMASIRADATRLPGGTAGLAQLLALVGQATELQRQALRA